MYTRLQTKTARWGGTYLYGLYNVVPPGLVVPSVLHKLSLPSLLRYRWLYILLAGFVDCLLYLRSFDFFRLLEAQMLNLVCYLITGESLAGGGGGAKTAPNARLDIQPRSFGLDRVPHSLTYGCATQVRNFKKNLTPQQIYRQHENEKKRMYAAELWRWNEPRSRRWCSPLQVAWHLNVKSITSD